MGQNTSTLHSTRSDIHEENQISNIAMVIDQSSVEEYRCFDFCFTHFHLFFQNIVDDTPYFLSVYLLKKCEFVGIL